MSGFNHYEDCTCGWCVNYGRMSRSERSRLESDMRHRDALRELKQASARSASGCYVNPNARCPVCDASVFFYANEHGSRVFFDDLGPPWPKHACTDIPRGFVPTNHLPLRRARGSMQELISAANVAGLFRNRVFGRRENDDWTMLVVLTVDREGDVNTVTAEFLDSRDAETMTFSCRSASSVLEVGNFISIKRDQVSFIHTDSLCPITFTIGETVDIPTQPPPDPVPTATGDTARDDPPKNGRLVHAFLKKPQDYRAPMTRSEMVHFDSDLVGLDGQFAKLEPVVKTYAREHTRKPSDVSRRLNAEGHRTAAGDVWTPRLVHFLLAHIFNHSRKHTQPPVRLEQASRRQLETSKMPAVEMDDRDEIARRLSTLGRVRLTKGSDRRRNSK